MNHGQETLECWINQVIQVPLEPFGTTKAYTQRPVALGITELSGQWHQRQTLFSRLTTDLQQ